MVASSTAAVSAPWLETASAFPSGVWARAVCAVALAVLRAVEAVDLVLRGKDLVGCEFVIVTSNLRLGTDEFM
jgi:hypothetical protein